MAIIAFNNYFFSVSINYLGLISVPMSTGHLGKMLKIYPNAFISLTAVELLLQFKLYCHFNSLGMHLNSSLSIAVFNAFFTLLHKVSSILLANCVVKTSSAVFKNRVIHKVN